jgi:hypothetical protein
LRFAKVVCGSLLPPCLTEHNGVVRLIAVSVGESITANQPRSASLFDDKAPRRAEAEAAMDSEMDSMREKFGKSAIISGRKLE